MSLLWALVLSLAVVSASLLPFHKMEKNIPRESFVKIGKSDPSHQHDLVFAVKQNNIDVLEKLLLERSTPGNPKYQQWLTYDEVTAMTSNPEATETVTSWLKANNVEVVKTTTRGDYITARTSIQQWESLLDTEFFEFHDHALKFKTKQLGGAHRAHEYSLPEHLVPHLSTVFYTVQTPPELHGDVKYIESGPELEKKKKEMAEGASLRGGIYSEAQTDVTPSFLTSLYDMYTHTGNASHLQTFFGTNNQKFSPTDLAKFQQVNSLPSQTCGTPYGQTATVCTFNSCGEANLDVQYLMSTAQVTRTEYWYFTSTSGADAFVDYIQAITSDIHPPQVNSISWGGVEQAQSYSVLQQWNTEAVKLNALGVTIVVSSGDNGVASSSTYCNYDSSWNTYPTSMHWTGATWSGQGYFPSFPATSPYVVAVGATMGPETGGPEVTCASQNGGFITSGGGFSTVWAAPSWQTIAVSTYLATANADAYPPTSGYNPGGRAYPDVSLIGVWYQIYLNGLPQSVFGTSASAPVFAGMISLVNAIRASSGQGPVGWINPTIYAQGATNNYFHDILSGHNHCCSSQSASSAVCCNSGFDTATGWDPVTGFGSIKLTNLVNMFNGAAAVSDPGAYGDDDGWTGGNDDDASGGATTLVLGAVIAIVVVCVIVGLCCCALIVLCAMGLLVVPVAGGIAVAGALSPGPSQNQMDNYAAQYNQPVMTTASAPGQPPATVNATFVTYTTTTNPVARGPGPQL